MNELQQQNRLNDARVLCVVLCVAAGVIANKADGFFEWALVVYLVATAFGGLYER